MRIHTVTLWHMYTRILQALQSCFPAQQCSALLSLYTATHCNTLQHTATHCNTLQHTVQLYCHCTNWIVQRADILRISAAFCRCFRHVSCTRVYTCMYIQKNTYMRIHTVTLWHIYTRILQALQSCFPHASTQEVHREAHARVVMNSRKSALSSFYIVHLAASWLFRNSFTKEAQRDACTRAWSEILKSWLTTQFGTCNDYRADFWECSACSTMRWGRATKKSLSVLCRWKILKCQLYSHCTYSFEQRADFSDVQEFVTKKMLRACCKENICWNVDRSSTYHKLQNTAKHRNTLQCTATHCSTL